MPWTVHAPSAEVPLAYTAGALVAGIHTASPVYFSIATTSSCFASPSDTNRTVCIVSPAAVEVATGLAASCT